ncbi:MAG TPA: ATP-binding protein [Methanocorpusculum sp.]|nr:ATP-binding protein [Methanocorpusculum sp.]
MIKRERYLAPIRAFYDDDLIKIITGIRRCGKSVILSQIYAEIQEKTDNAIYINFEDLAFGSLLKADALLRYIEDRRKEGMLYVFLDEVQRVDGWQNVCRTLRIRNCSVFISGSNSKLLSSEFTRELSGRYVAFHINPFVYTEICAYLKELGREASISDYLVWGGFPQRLTYPTEDAMRQYLNDLYTTIILNDIIARYRIRKPELFKRLAVYVFTSNSRIFSARSIETELKKDGWDCSIATIVRYIGYLEDAYAISAIAQYSTKAKHVLQYYRKLYNTDVAFNSLFHIDRRFDLTHNLENIVYNELIYRGYDLQVYTTRDGKEIDFLARKDGKEYYVQVAYSVAEDTAYKREFAAFRHLDGLQKKILITADELDYSTAVVEHIRLKDFLVMDALP